jgi:hypothetical protein
MTQINEARLMRLSEFELFWQMSRRVTLLPTMTQTHL